MKVALDNFLKRLNNERHFLKTNTFLKPVEINLNISALGVASICSYCQAKRSFDVFGGCVGFEKTCVTFLCGKMLKHSRILFVHNLTSTLRN